MHDLVVSAESHILFCRALVIDFETSVLTCQAVQLGLQLLLLDAKRIDPVVSVFLDLIYADYGPFEMLSFFEQFLVHFLDLFALHLVLFFERQVFFQLEL